MKFRGLSRDSILYLALASFAVVMIVQVIWLKNTFRLQERDFDEKVKNTLRFFNTDFQDNSLVKQQLTAVWNGQTTADKVQPLLRYTVDTCFQRNGLPTDYVMGLGYTKKKMFWSDKPALLSKINDSRFSIIALCMEEKGAFEMKFHFPGKQACILSSLTPLLLFTGFGFLVLITSFLWLAYLLKRQTKLSEVKNDFVNNMTHELKTPLFTVSIASRMLAEQDDKAEPKRTRYIQSIQQEVKRLNNLVEKILLTSLLEKRKLTLEKGKVDLHASIARVVKGFELIQAEKGGAVHTNLTATLHDVAGDEIHIENSIYNLLDNAFKYSIEKPNILITTRNVGNAIALSIKDNGIGFNNEEKELVFDRFFRVHTGNLHNVKGYGIGLSYVKTVVEAHNGTISVNSKHHAGSEFILQFPLY